MQRKEVSQNQSEHRRGKESLRWKKERPRLLRRSRRFLCSLSSSSSSPPLLLSQDDALNSVSSVRSGLMNTATTWSNKALPKIERLLGQTPGERRGKVLFAFDLKLPPSASFPLSSLSPSLSLLDEHTIYRCRSSGGSHRLYTSLLASQRDRRVSDADEQE